MAYQNVGVPRFYIDIPTYINSLGLPFTNVIVNNSLLTLEPIIAKKLFNANATQPTEQSLSVNLGTEFSYVYSDFCNSSNLYLAIINHNLGEGCGITINNSKHSNITNILNQMGKDTAQKGSSIATFSNDDNDSLQVSLTKNQDVGVEIFAGAFSFGTFYDMPVSPDLKISMDLEFDGYDMISTLGGSTLTNVRYSGSPMWFDKDKNKTEPFSVGNTKATSKRNGRRNWTLKFSYISDTDIFSSNYMSNNYLETSTEYDANDIDSINTAFKDNINNDDSFTAQVLNKIGNGQRFIFQPDNTNNNPDQFAICILDQKSISIKQIAYKAYDISLKIREVW